MTSINTNLSSLIVQKNLTKSTNALDKALERLTTGFKINHASDNAANYSISESMSSKLSSYMVAEDNTSMGLDLIRTQSSTLDTIQNLTTRLRALAEQAHNGTYGAQSLEAINQEAGAIIDEITRIGNNAEYNGIKLFDNALSQAGIPQLKSNSLMQEIERRDTSGMTKLADVENIRSIAAGTTYSISTAEELAMLANINDCHNCTFVLASDIDLTEYCKNNEWMGLDCFNLVFDGNGYTISNLTSSYGGLFAYLADGEISNLRLENVNINTDNEILYNSYNDDYMNVGGMIGIANNIDITNCYVDGSIDYGIQDAGLLIGTANCVNIDSCATSGVINSSHQVGGLVGAITDTENSTVQNCISGADVTSLAGNAGGLIGTSTARLSLTNSASSGSVHANNYAGGIIGIQSTYDAQLNNLVYTGSELFSDKGRDLGAIIGRVVNNSIQVSANNLIYDSSLSNVNKSIGKVNNLENLELSECDTASYLQVGVDSTDSSNIKFTTNISLASVNALRLGGMEGVNSLENIDNFISKLSEAQTKLGAIENRLTSTIESIGVNIENLTSSRSTLKDADVAKESSQMLKNQILQQASATLLATANQTPALALRLLGGIQ